VLVSANGIRSLRRLRRLEPRIAIGIGYPRDRIGVGGWPWPARVGRTAVEAGRALLPRRIPLMLSLSGADVVMIHRSLVTADAVAAAHTSGAAFFTWTVNDPASVELLNALDVDGITTDDPQMAVAAVATLAVP
jgi:glycerophosphoryl diester phosphodiesterase